MSNNLSDRPSAIIMGISHPVTGEPFILELPLKVAFSFFLMMEKGGTSGIVDLMFLGAALIKDGLPVEEFYGLQRAAAEIEKILRREWQDNEDMLLNHSYTLLHNKAMTRDQAAQFASSALGRPITANAWRKKTDRWGEKQGLPALGQTKRRPRRRVSGQNEDA
jgi:hypothetical protein